MLRAARWLAVVCLASSSGGCVLTQDLPDPALDVPTHYKYAGKADAPPTLDWWRGFRSAELTQLMEEAQTVNLDIAAAVSRIVEADAQARQAGAALLPSLSGGGSETYSRTSGSQRQRSHQWRPRGRQLLVLAQRQLPARFLGPEPRRAADRGRDRERRTASIATSVALTTLDRGRQRLFPGAVLAGPPAHRAAQHRERAAHPRRHQGAPQGRHRHRSRRRPAGERARQPEGAGAAAAPDARPERQRARRAGVAAAGERARRRRLAATGSRSRASRPACRRRF